jgi:hypothetical protein
MAKHRSPMESMGTEGFRRMITVLYNDLHFSWSLVGIHGCTEGIHT